MSDTVARYLNEISKYPLLDKNQEIVLARRVQDWQNSENPTPAQVRSGKRAHEKLVRCNLRLVVSIAKRYTRRLMRSEMLDLIQEGSIGLAKGVEKYDPERGYALSTYVYWWIRQSITRYLQNSERMIKLPSGGVESVLKARTFSIDYHKRNGAAPSVEECAEHCKISVGRMTAYLQHVKDCTSLDQKLREEDGGSTFLDLLEYDNESGEDMLDRVAFQCGADFLNDCLYTLTEHEREIISLYYGIGTATPQTLTYIGKAVGLSRERIRQKHDRAMMKLRVHAIGKPRCA